MEYFLHIRSGVTQSLVSIFEFKSKGSHVSNSAALFPTDAMLMKYCHVHGFESHIFPPYSICKEEVPLRQLSPEDWYTVWQKLPRGWFLNTTNIISSSMGQSLSLLIFFTFSKLFFTFIHFKHFIQLASWVACIGLPKDQTLTYSTS